MSISEILQLENAKVMMNQEMMILIMNIGVQQTMQERDVFMVRG